MIEVRNLSKHFGPTVAVDEISFDVARGEVVGFLGPNGAGKSTTMRVLTGYLPPTGGSAKVAGIDLLDDSLAVRRRIGYLPESAPLYGDMEVVDFLRFIADVRGISPGETRERIAKMLRRCGLEKVVGRAIHHLSKGFRQRVGIAQAMIHDPDLLILDEPTSGLDPNQIIEIRELIKEVGREKTVILSTHILPEVSATCGRVIIINEGAIVASGTVDEIAAGTEGKGMIRAAVRGDSKESVESVLAGAEFIDTFQIEPGAAGLLEISITSSERENLGERVFRLAVDNGWSLAELKPTGSSLEDVFRHLTVGSEAAEGVEVNE